MSLTRVPSAPTRAGPAQGSSDVAPAHAAGRRSATERKTTVSRRPAQGLSWVGLQATRTGWRWGGALIGVRLGGDHLLEPLDHQPRHTPGPCCREVPVDRRVASCRRRGQEPHWHSPFRVPSRANSTARRIRAPVVRATHWWWSGVSSATAQCGVLLRRRNPTVFQESMLRVRAHLGHRNGGRR